MLSPDILIKAQRYNLLSLTDSHEKQVPHVSPCKVAMFWFTGFGCIIQHGGQDAGSDMRGHKNFKGSDNSEVSAYFSSVLLFYRHFFFEVLLWKTFFVGYMRVVFW